MRYQVTWPDAFAIAELTAWCSRRNWVVAVEIRLTKRVRDRPGFPEPRPN